MRAADHETYELQAPVDGIVVAIADVPDPVFSQETLGPGIAIEPLGNTLRAPAAGKVIQCASTSHAVTLQLAPGVEILLHLGIDTVGLNGEGLQLLVHAGDQVAAGTPLIRFDVDKVAQGATSLVTPLISIGQKKITVAQAATGHITAGTLLAKLSIAPAQTPGLANVNTDEYTTVTQTLTLALENGLHARPASRLKQISARAGARVVLSHNDQEADASHLTSLLNLGLMPGDKLTLTVTGPDAQQTAAEIKHFLETPEGIVSAVVQKPVKHQNDTDKGIWHGVTASPGQGVGLLRRFSISLPEICEKTQNPAAEINHFFAARQTLLQNLKNAVHASISGSEQADILTAHIDLIDDDNLTQRALDLINSGKSSAAAWKITLDERIAELAASANPLIRERTGDLRDLQLQLIKLLSANPSKNNEIEPSLAGSILVADDLTPSQVIALANIKPAGICLAAGGATSHVAVLCRSAAIPCLIGLGSSILDESLFREQNVILDADNGTLHLAPTDTELQAAKTKIAKQAQRERYDQAEAQMPAISKDGRTIDVAANITTGAEAAKSLVMGADAIGLFRSEFLFLDREDAPSEEEQKQQYQQALDAMHGKPVIIRMLDIGADKQLPWLNMGTCPNPALGIRGIRLLETCPALIETQLRALLQVKAGILPDGKSALQIMLPMVSDIHDVIQVRAMIEKLADQLKLKQRKDFVMPQLGVMIEVPSAALTAAQLAKTADFFSIGTNDLTQYSLAMDREEPKLSQRLDILHPALLRLVGLCCSAAGENHCPVAVCGAAAGDDIAGLVLAALGASELSVEPQRIAAVKARLRKTDLQALRAEVEKVLCLPDAEQVRQKLGKYLSEHCQHADEP